MSTLNMSKKPNTLDLRRNRERELLKWLVDEGRCKAPDHIPEIDRCDFGSITFRPDLAQPARWANWTAYPILNYVEAKMDESPLYPLSRTDKEVVFEVKGKARYGNLKTEMGRVFWLELQDAMRVALSLDTARERVTALHIAFHGLRVRLDHIDGSLGETNYVIHSERLTITYIREGHIRPGYLHGRRRHIEL